MKKQITAILSIILVAVLAVPAFANIDLNGSIETQFELRRDAANNWTVDTRNGVEVRTGLSARGDHGVRATVKLDAIRASNLDNDGNPQFPITAPHPSANMELNVTEAYLETVGSYWNGGPNLYTRVGDIDVRWNPFVANLGRARGIVVDGFDLGMANARTFVAWDAAGNRHYGLQAIADIEGIGVDATLVRTGGAQEAGVRAYAHDAIPGMKLDGYVAVDADFDPAYRVNAAFESAPGITLLAGYRGNHGFDGTHTDTRAYDAHTGFNLGVEAEQSGVKFTAGYDQPTSVIDMAAETTVEQIDVWAKAKMVSSNLDNVEIGAKREVPLVEGLTILGEYNGKIVPSADPEHTLKASTKTSIIPQLQGLELNGQVKLVGTSFDSWKAGAAYDAPNGFNFGAEYDSVNGPSVTAGLKANF